MCGFFKVLYVTIIVALLLKLWVQAVNNWMIGDGSVPRGPYCSF